MVWKNAADDAPVMPVLFQPADLLFHLPANAFYGAMSGNFSILLMLPSFPFYEDLFSLRRKAQSVKPFLYFNLSFYLSVSSWL
jgi:hypothetical protein